MSPKNESCRRCGQSPFIILDKVHVECKTCFIDSSMRKFKQAIGKSKLVNSNDALLVAYSGGQSSCAMLDLLKTRLETSTSLEPRCRPSILYIDMQSTLCNSSLSDIMSDRSANLTRVLGDLKRHYPNWPIYWTVIESAMLNDGNPRFDIFETANGISNSSLLKNCDALANLLKAINQSGDLTDRQKSIDRRKIDLVNEIADEINSDIKNENDKLKLVLLGSCATQLANNLLVDVILGLGSTVRTTVSLTDERLAVPILRPMRDFSKKEIAFYLKAKNLESSTQPNLLTKADRKACIQTATEAFLSKLYVDYPATYNTLLKTGGKLA